ncbi:MAG: hypothetical protein ACKKMP_01765 [Candidatus Nealsonbacteria bacterium]
MDRREKKEKGKEVKKEKRKLIIEKANLLVEVGNKAMVYYKEKEKLERILNKNSVKKSNRNKVDIFPLEVKMEKLERRDEKLENLYFEAKKSLEIERDKPLLH